MKILNDITNNVIHGTNNVIHRTPFLLFLMPLFWKGLRAMFSCLYLYAENVADVRDSKLSQYN
jgi:hypothetical protein